MKAKDFIEKFGWEESQEIVKGIPDKFRFECLSNFCWDMNTYKYLKPRTPRNSLVNLSNLKQYMDAWELVSNNGGLIDAKKYLNDGIVPSSNSLAELKQAIQLIESIEVKNV